jgi:hypothetical protein
MKARRVGILRVEREVVEVSSLDPREPDPDWSFVDAAGHEHRWAGSATPTLEERVVERWWCHSCCDEHVDSILVCAQCGQRVAPGTRRGPAVQYLPGSVTYYLNDEPIPEERWRELVQNLSKET